MTLSIDNRQEIENDKRPSRAPNIGQTERLASIVGGTIFTLFGLSQKGSTGAVMALIGGGLAFRGISGFSPIYKTLGIDTTESGSASGTTNQGGTIHVERSVFINRSTQDLYDFWRNFENLPGIMKHLKSVQVYDEKRSHWVASAPMNNTVAWDAEIIDEQNGEYIVWQSLEKADVSNRGSIEFIPGPEGRGTKVRVKISYEPLAGALGKTFLSLFGEEPTQQVVEDLRRFKAMMETGEVATIAGQSRGQT